MREFISIIILLSAVLCVIASITILFSKNKEKIKGSLTITVVLFVLYFIISPGSTSDIAKEEKQQDGPENVTQAIVTSNVGNPTSLGNQETEQYLFNSTDEFKNAFNQYCASHELDFRINSIKIKQGEVYNVFSYMINDNLGLSCSIIKSTGKVKEIGMVGTGDGTVTSGGNIFLCMIAIIATVDPTIPVESRGKILKKLKLFDKNVNITDMSQETIMNGIKYTINSNPNMGLWFTASTDTN